MNSTHSPIRSAVLNFPHLSGEQRVLVEQVTRSPSAKEGIRRRAQALLLLDEGAPTQDIQSRAHIDPRTLRSLIKRHAEGGVRAALLGIKASLERRRWLALSPLRSE